MGYLEKNLLPDEQVHYHTKKHIIIFLTPALWTLATIIFLFNANPAVVMAAIVFAVVALFSWADKGLDYTTSDYYVTNKRILMKEGFFTRHSNELRLSTVSNMTVNQSLIGQLFDFGTILISPFGGNNDIFPDIAHPFEFQKQTQAQLDKLVR